jgi:transcriptional regulator with XRE-family HTH domain
MSSHAPDQARVIPQRPAAPAARRPARAVREPLWRHIVGDVLRRERLAQERTLKDVADAARISMPYLSEVERGLKEASSEVLAAAARALGLGLADVLTLATDELVRLAHLGLAHAPAVQVVPADELSSEPAAPAGGDGGPASPVAVLGGGHGWPRVTSRLPELSLAA